MKKRSYLSIILSFLLIFGFSLVNLYCKDGGTHTVHIPKDPKVATCEPGKWGGTLKLALSGAPLTFNPFISPSVETYEITSKLFATLIDYDNVNKKANNDGLARSVDTLENGSSYVIHLREGVAFSNGVPITAEDVIFSLKAALDDRLNSIYGEFMKVDGQAPEFSKMDSLTVKITFAEHYEPIKELLSKIPIVSKTSMEDYFLKGDPKTAYTLTTAPEKIVSSGPFVLKSYSEQKIELVYNPYYWKVDNVGTALPYLDGITYDLKVSRQGQQNNLLTKNEYHAVELIPTQKQAFEGNDRFIIKDAGPSLAVWQLVLNWRLEQQPGSFSIKPTWARTSYFRWAISALIERDKMVSDVFNSLGRPVYGLVTPDNQLWFNNEAKKYPYDINAAKKFLGLAKFSNSSDNTLRDNANNKVRYELLHLNEYIPQQLANRLAEDLKQVGIEIEPNPQDYKKFLSFVNNGLFEAALVESTPLLPDPAFMQPFLSKSGRYLYFDDSSDVNLKGMAGSDPFLNNVAKDLNEALKKSSLKERQDIYNKVQKDWADKYPIIYLVNENVLVAAQKNLANFKPAPIIPTLTWNSEEFYLKQ